NRANRRGAPVRCAATRKELGCCLQHWTRWPMSGLKPADIDGIATAGETPVTVAQYLGLTPKWVDGTAVGGCSFMIHVRHAAAAIASGLCQTGLDHAWRERPLRRRAHPQCR